jgi:two-component system sensor kinase FixL
VPQIIEMLAPPGQMTIRLADDLPVIQGDPVRLTQVFQNLLSNAVKFMDKPDGQITVGCVDAGARWTFRVEDNGPGIDARHHERIFQIFQTGAPRDESESTGIGLTVVKKIVEFYGGRVWVESEPGQGSRFYFTWPKRPEDQE